MAASEPSDLALDAALLVGAVGAGLAEERVEPVVRAQGDEPFRLCPVPAAQHALHRRLQVVVADPARHPTDVLERPDVAVEERLLGLVQIHAVEALAGR